MDEKTINDIKWKADEMMRTAKQLEKAGDKENAAWYEGYALGVIKVLFMADAISATEYAGYFEEIE